MALASCGVRVGVVPLPKLTPPLDAVPGWMRRLLAPMFLMVRCTAVLVPWPISVMAMTADTPMTMPRVVSADRITLRCRALRAIFRVRIRALIADAPFVVATDERRGLSPPDKPPG